MGFNLTPSKRGVIFVYGKHWQQGGRFVDKGDKARAVVCVTERAEWSGAGPGAVGSGVNLHPVRGGG